MAIIMDSGLRTQDSGLRTQDSGLRTQDSGLSYNYALNLVKFFMALVIVIYHYNFFYLNWESNVYFRGGYICVDAFFVISGFFCAKLISSLPSETGIYFYIKRRLKSLYPCYITALLLSLFVHIWLHGFPGLRGAASFVQEIFMIQEWGIYNIFPYYNGATWYISAMIFVSCFYFVLSKYFTGKRQAYIIAVMCVVCFAAIILKYGHIHVHGIIKRHISLGIMRAFSGMGTGWFIFRYRDKLSIPHSGTVFIVSFIMLAALTLYTKDSCVDVLIYPVSAILLLSSGNISVSSPLIRNVLLFSGRMSYALYLCHGAVQNAISYMFPEYSLMLFLAVSMVMSFLLIYIAGRMR